MIWAIDHAKSLSHIFAKFIVFLCPVTGLPEPRGMAVAAHHVMFDKFLS
jgi:hypothetical protein